MKTTQGSFKEVAQILAGNTKGTIILGGDFNCVISNFIDKFPFEQKYQISKYKAVNNTIEELGLVDIWRVKNPKTRDYTHFSRVHKSYSTIDYFCISKQEAHSVDECYIEPQTLTDHGPVVMSLCIDPNKPRRLWRLNVSLLNNLEVVQKIRNE